MNVREKDYKEEEKGEENEVAMEEKGRGRRKEEKDEEGEEARRG